MPITQQAQGTIKGFFAAFDTKNVASQLEIQLEKNLKAINSYNQRFKVFGNSIDAQKELDLDSSVINLINEANGGQISDEALNKYKQSQKDIISNYQGMSISSKAAALGASALNAALNVGVMMLVSAAIQGLISLFTHLANAQQEAIDKANELTSTYNETRKTIEGNISSLQGVQSEFAVLAQGVDDYGNNISLSADKYARYQEIVGQVLEQNPSLIEGYTKEGKALADKNKLIERAIELQRIQQEQNLQEYLSDDTAKDKAKGAIAEYETARTENQDIIVKMADGVGSVSANDIEIAKLLGLEKTDVANSGGLYSAVIDNAETAAKNALANQEKLKALMDPQAYQELINGAKEYNNVLNDGSSEMATAAAGYNDYMKLAITSADGFSTLSDQQQAFVNNWIDGFKITSGTTKEQLMAQKNAFIQFTTDLAHNPSARNAVTEFMSLDKSTMNADEWTQQAEELFNTISTALDLSEDDQHNLRIGFGLTFTDENGQEIDSSSLKSRIDEKLNLSDTDLSDLTAQEIEIAYKILPTLDPDISFDELQNEINAAMDKLELFGTTDHVNLEQIISECNNLTNSVGYLRTAQEELNESGTLSQATIDQLSAAGYANAIAFDENGKAIGLNKNQVDARTNSVINALRYEIEYQKYLVNERMKDLAGTMLSYSDANERMQAEEDFKKASAEKRNLEEYEKQIFNSDTSFVKTPVRKSSPSSAKSQPTVSDEFTKAKAEADDQRARDLIDEQEYYDKRLALYEKYVKGKAGLEDLEKSELKDLDQLKKNLNQDIIDSYDDEIDKLKDVEGSEDDRLRLVQEKKAAIEKIMAEAREAGKSETSEYYKSLVSMLEDTVEQEKDILEEKRENEHKAFLEDIDASKDRIASYKDQDQGEISGELMVEEADAVMKAINNRIEELRGEDSKANKEYIKELQKQYQELYDSRLEGLQMILDAEKKQIDDSISAAREALEKERKATEEYWNEEIKAYKRKHEAQEKVNTLKEKELQLENLKKQRNVLTYMEGQGFVYTADTEAVEAAQEDLDKTREEYEYQAQLQRMEDAKEKALQAIDDELAKLNEQQEFWDRYFEDFELNSKTAQDIHEDWVKNQGEKFVEQTQAVTNYADTYTAQLERMIEKIRELNALESGRELKGELKSGASSGKGKGYASGTAYVPNSGTYLVNENGPEAIFKPGTGTYEYLPQGTVVFSAAATRNLWNWSKLSPAHAFSSSHLPSISVPQVNSINIGDVILNGVQDTDRLSREIVDRLPLALQQEFYKR